MRNISSNAILFNVSGAAVLLTVAGYMSYAFFHTEAATPCTARYPAGVQFAFDDHAGNVLTPIELQGRVGSREWGVLKNANIVRSKDNPGGASLEVAMAPAGDDDIPGRSGVGFAWPTAELAQAQSACLSYSVFMPGTFAFSEPGHLPGLYAASDVGELDETKPEDGFAARLGWHRGGTAGVDVRAAGAEESWQGAVSGNKWPKGRWVPVEQEVILKSPAGGKTGTIRMWIDGKLQVENASVPLGSDSKLSGVVADIGYTRAAESEPDTLRLSPFVVQWQ
jgi:hypothetical protein